MTAGELPEEFAQAFTTVSARLFARTTVEVEAGRRFFRLRHEVAQIGSCRRTKCWRLRFRVCKARVGF